MTSMLAMLPERPRQQADALMRELGETDESAFFVGLIARAWEQTFGVWPEPRDYGAELDALAARVAALEAR